MYYNYKIYNQFNILIQFLNFKNKLFMRISKNGKMMNFV